MAGGFTSNSSADLLVLAVNGTWSREGFGIQDQTQETESSDRLVMSAMGERSVG